MKLPLILLYRVTLADQSVYEAQVVGFDQDKDVAVLRIKAPMDKLLITAKPLPCVDRSCSAAVPNCPSPC